MPLRYITLFLIGLKMPVVLTNMLYIVATIGRGYYSEQTDNKVDEEKHMDGYAGKYGKRLDRLQIRIN